MNINSNTPLVSVIVPTMASAERASLLKRAVVSIRTSSQHPVRIIAVVNGDRFDSGVCDWLKAQSDIVFEYLAQPSLPGALLRGRELVETVYFSTLDDDDEYLANSTDQKVAILKADGGADLVVGNYYRHRAGDDSLGYANLSNVLTSPIESLMNFNWLSSGNALFCSDSVGVNYFTDYHSFGEWTFMAFRMALDGKKVVILDEPVFRCNEETLGSLSKSKQYFQAYIPLFQRMLKFSPPPHIATLIQRKISSAYHDASVAALQEGERKQAFLHHWQSLCYTGGLRYLSFTRHLFR